MAGRLVPRIALFALLAALALGTAGAAASHDAHHGSECNKEKPVCLKVVATPASVTASREGSPAYVQFTATVTGNSYEKRDTKLTVSPLVADTADGFVLESATPSAGTCSLDHYDPKLTCSLGKLRRGAVVTVDLVVKAPQSPGEASLEFKASTSKQHWDGYGWDDDHGSGSSVTVTKTIDVTAPGGPTATSFVPEGAPLGLDTAKSGQTESVDLPAQEFSTTAALGYTSTAAIPFECPHYYVCRKGDWFSATIPGTFDPTAKFDLFWPAELISPKQTVKNFVVFYVRAPGAPVEIIKKRCGCGKPVVPCIAKVKKFTYGPLKGGFAATVVRDDNGHMR